MSRAPMTKKGADRLRAELERLKSVDRPRIIAAIAEARAHGDLKENAEYHAAREQQSFCEGRINELEAALSTAEVFDTSRLSAGSRVVFGAIVDLEDEDSGDSVTYQIVGDLEALTPFENLRDKNLRDEVSDLLAVLDEREKKIIFSRFGLDGGKAKTLEEVGKKFGVTRERIRQLQNIALMKLRRALQKKEKPIDHLLPAHVGGGDFDFDQ